MSLDWYKGKEWSMEKKGLHKRVLDIKFSKMEKPAFLATCSVNIKEVKNLNGRPTKYLDEEKLGHIQTVELLSAVTPVDYYVELLLQQMIVGETAQCEISTAEQPIQFTMTLESIIKSRDFHTLTPGEMYDLAMRLKQNGIEMYKLYPKFAHEYFARAAKCLLSFKNFDGLEEVTDGIDGDKMRNLLLQLQTNLAANLLTQQRYEDVIYMTEFVDSNTTDVSEKAIYRRAVALYHLKEYEKAQNLIEKRIPLFQERKEFAKLYQQISQDWKSSNQQYKHVVQRMFNK